MKSHGDSCLPPCFDEEKTLNKLNPNTSLYYETLLLAGFRSFVIKCKDIFGFLLPLRDVCVRNNPAHIM